MSRKIKYTPEQKIQICKEYLAGDISMQLLCEKHGIPFSKKRNTCDVYKWIVAYRKNGVAAFVKGIGNASYTKEFKITVIEEYLSGSSSLWDICIKYNISSESTLSKWIKCYNANRELKDYFPKREVYMAEARRKTTIDERKEIVEYCINHNRNYKDTAELFNVSYSQIYSWVKKYDTNGEKALSDKRGHHKTDYEVDELERLRRENLRLKHQLEEKDMLTELLKKVKEFEGM